MALVNKRIIDLPQRTILRSDDYVAVDSSDGGTAKYNITELETAVDDVAPIIVNTSPTASVLALTDGAEDKAMKKLTLNLLPHQAGSGDPSPSNVRAISGYDSVTVTRSGKNLFDSDGIFLSASGWKYENGYYYGNARAIHDAYKNGIDLLPHNISEVCTVSFDAYNSTGQKSVYVYVVYTDGTTFRIAVEATDWYHYSFTTTNGKTIKYFMMSYSYGVVTYIRNFQIEVGSAETTYEPYQGETYPITLPQTIYGGELDVVSGVLKVTHGYAVYDGSSDEDWTASGNDRMLASLSDSYAEGYTRIAVTANRGIFGTGSTVGTTFLSNKSLHYYQPTNITTVSDFRTWLASNNLQVVYPLATPTEITLDPTTIKNLLGTNTIWMSADGTIQADYCADTKMYIDALTAPDDDMVANSNIENGKYFTVNNKLYISTSAIAQGEQIIVGTNCTQTDLATALNALNA